MHTLAIDGIFLERNGATLLSNIYLSVQTGHIAGILGRNGQGKSTLFEIIYGIRPNEKSIRFDHVSITEPFRFPDKITFLPQYHFIPGMLRVCNIFSEFGLSFSEFIQAFPSLSNSALQRFNQLSGDKSVCRYNQ